MVGFRDKGYVDWRDFWDLDERETVLLRDLVGNYIYV